MFKLLITLATLSMTSSYAQSSQSELKAVQQPKKFLPHMAIHMNKGCQQNSTCSVEIGKLNIEWDNVLKSKSERQIKNFQKRYGVPMSFWTTQEKNPAMVTFDSRCSKHRKKDHKIYEGIMFVKSPSELTKKETILENYALREQGSKFYTIPRKALPNGIINGALNFTQEREGQFYYLNSTPNRLEVSFNKPQFDKEIIETSCPEALRKTFISKLKNERLYQSTFCKNIWNYNKKKYERVIFGWSCL
jgi:hypothetical protein